MKDFLISLGSMIFGAFLIYFAWNSHHELLKSNQGEKVVGVVVTVTSEVNRSSGYQYHAEINYMTKDSQKYTITDNNPHQVGEQVELSYDSTNPGSAIVSRPVTYGFITIIFFLIGLGSIIFGFYINVLVAKEWKDKQGFGIRKIIEENGKYGFSDKSGNTIIPIKYESVNNFKEGLARVKLNQKYGFINTKGKEIIPIIYDSAEDFENGLAKVQLNDKKFYIDEHGK